MSDEISKEVKEAWQGAQDIRRACADAHVVRLADAFRHERAMRLKAEFLANHTMCFGPQDLGWRCGDIHHFYTDAGWEKMLEKELSE